MNRNYCKVAIPIIFSVSKMLPIISKLIRRCEGTLSGGLVVTQPDTSFTQMHLPDKVESKTLLDYNPPMYLTCHDPQSCDLQLEVISTAARKLHFRIDIVMD